MNRLMEFAAPLAGALEHGFEADRRECPKDAVNRWWAEDIAAKTNLRLALVDALEGAGFVKIRIWRNEYEQCFSIWHFSFALSSIPSSERNVARYIRAACGKAGFRIKKDFMALILNKTR